MRSRHILAHYHPRCSVLQGGALPALPCRTDGLLKPRRSTSSPKSTGAPQRPLSQAAPVTSAAASDGSSGGRWAPGGSMTASQPASPMVRGSIEGSRHGASSVPLLAELPPLQMELRVPQRVQPWPRLQQQQQLQWPAPALGGALAASLLPKADSASLLIAPMDSWQAEQQLLLQQLAPGTHGTGGDTAVLCPGVPAAAAAGARQSQTARAASVDDASQTALRGGEPGSAAARGEMQSGEGALIGSPMDHVTARDAFALPAQGASGAGPCWGGGLAGVAGFGAFSPWRRLPARCKHMLSAPGPTPSSCSGGRNECRLPHV